MKKLKRPTKGQILFVVFACILLLYGLPFVDKDITKGYSKRVAYQDTYLSQFVYKYSKIVLFILIVVGISEYFLGKYLHHRASKITNKRSAKRMIFLSKTAGWHLSIASVFFAGSIVLHYGLMLFSQNLALREYARCDFVFGIAILFVYLMALFELIEYRKNWKYFTVNYLMASPYWQEYDKLYKKKKYQEAEKVITEICQLDPTSINAWAVRAQFSDMELGKPEEAMTCLQNATRNLKENINVNDKEKATYEYCVGIIKLHRGNTAEGLSHLQKSLELEYDDGKAEFIKKLEKELGPEVY